MDEAGKAEEASFLEAEAKDKAEAAVKTSGGGKFLKFETPAKVQSKTTFYILTSPIFQKEKKLQRHRRPRFAMFVVTWPSRTWRFGTT